MRTVKLSTVLRHRAYKIKIDDATTYKLVRIRLHRKGVTLRHEKRGAEIRTKTQQLCKDGDFIVAEMDAKVGGYGFIPKSLEGAIVSSHYYLYEIDEKQLLPAFLNVVCQAGILQEQIVAKGSTNYASVRAHTVLEWTIPLPSLDDQRRIANQFDQAEAANKELAFEITHQHSLLGKLKQAILQEAIQGKLTADWRAANPDVEPASELLQRIQAEKARLIDEKKIRKEKPLPEITSEEIPFEIPDSWEWTNLDSTSKFTNGKAHEQLVDPKGKFILINSRFVSTGGDTKKFAREVLTPLSVGAVVMVMSDVPNGRALARCFIVDEENRYTLNQRIGGFEMLGEIVPEFAHHVLDRNQYLLSFNDGKKQTNLKKRQIQACPFPLPPLAEQAAIVERVEALMATCRELEAEIERSRTHAADLLQAVLKEAFAPAS